MSKDRIVEFKTPVEEEDLLSELPRVGARKLIAGAVEAEFAGFLRQYAGGVDGRGRRSVVRNGYLPEREIQTGIGPVRGQVQPATATTLPEENKADRGVASLALPQGSVHGGFPGGPGGPAGR